MKTHNSEAGFVHMTVIVIAVLALVVGTGVFLASRQPSALDSEVELQQSAVVKPLPDSFDQLKTISEIQAIIAADADSATVDSLELEQEGASPVYIATLSNGMQVRYNAVTGKLIATKQQADDHATVKPLPTKFAVSVTLEQAREIAVKQSGGKTIQKIHLESEDGAVVYSVRFTDGTRLTINAKTSGVETGTQDSREKSSASDEHGSKSASGNVSSSFGENKTSATQSSGSGSSHEARSVAPDTGGAHGSDD